VARVRFERRVRELRRRARAAAASVALLVTAASAACTTVTPPPRPKVVVVPPDGPLAERSLVRAVGDERVYVVLDGERHHLSDRRTLEALGFRYDAIMDLPEARVVAVPEGYALESDHALFQVGVAGATPPDRTLVRSHGDPRVFLVLLGQRHWIRRKDSVTALGVDGDHIVELPNDQLANIPEGPAW
jgi:hypothetical protein